ncbi:MAG: ribonuclease HIII [Bacteroidota bacterium]
MNIKDSAQKQIEAIHKEVQILGLKVSSIQEKKYNFEFLISSAQDQVKVQVYFGKKGVKIILQGNKESLLYKEIHPVIFNQHSFEFSKTEGNEPDEYIGSDESGKGDVFGPLVVGAFYLNKKNKKVLSSLGVRDSKELSDTQIDGIAKIIEKELKDDYEIVIINPEKYNELYSKWKNLNSMLTWAHSTAINNLLKRKDCKEVISDKFSNQSLMIELNMNSEKVNVLQIHKAEKYLGVAAASIIARSKLNNWFRIKKSQGMNLPKGASQDVNNFLINFVPTANKINKLAKLHFKNIKTLL